MSIEEENKAVVRRIIEEVWNKGNLEILNELFDSNYVVHSTRGDTIGTDGLKQAITMFRSAFPDLHCTIEDMIAQGDKVASRITSMGTFKGELMGIAPTGKQVALTEALFHNFKDGKAVEAWNYSDQLTMFQQLGITPPAQ